VLTINRRIVACSACVALLAVALVGPQVGFAQGAPVAQAAKSKQVVLVLSGRQTSSTTAAGNIASRQLGAGTFVETFKSGVTSVVAKFKGGTIKWSEISKVSGSSVSGKWKVTGGTGTYKHVHGGGPAKGPLSGPWTYSGTITY
jgi:hypothetical protein